MQYRKQLTREQALQKLRHYCAYQERSHYEVRQKLFDLGVWKKDHDEITATLIEENYLNEQRFAIAYAGGKWRMKQWGRNKIRFELKQRQVSDYCIKKALKQIGDDEYEQTLRVLAADKYAALCGGKGDNGEERGTREAGGQYLGLKKKTIDYLIQKGYEPELVTAVANEITKRSAKR